MAPHSTPTFETLTLDIEDDIATITLTGVDETNALAFRAWGDIKAALEGIAEREEVRAVIFRGNAAHFTSGWTRSRWQKARSLFEIGKVGVQLFRKAGDEQALEEISASNVSSRDALEVLYNLPQLTIAAIDGSCFDVGAALALACKRRIGTPRARIKLPRFGEVHARVYNLLGRKTTRALAKAGEELDAERAHDLKLLDEVVSPDALHARARAVAIGVIRPAAGVSGVGWDALRHHLYEPRGLDLGLICRTLAALEGTARRVAYDYVCGHLDALEPGWRTREVHIHRDLILPPDAAPLELEDRPTFDTAVLDQADVAIFAPGALDGLVGVGGLEGALASWVAHVIAQLFEEEPSPHFARVVETYLRRAAGEEVKESVAEVGEAAALRWADDPRSEVYYAQLTTILAEDGVQLGVAKLHAWLTSYPRFIDAGAPLVDALSGVGETYQRFDAHLNEARERGGLRANMKLASFVTGEAADIGRELFRWREHTAALKERLATSSHEAHRWERIYDSPMALYLLRELEGRLDALH